MAGRRALKVMVQRTKRTDLTCMACGRFRTEYEVVVAGGGEPHAGVHTACMESVHHKRSSPRAGSAAPVEVGEDTGGEDLGRHEAEVAEEEEAMRS